MMKFPFKQFVVACFTLFSLSMTSLAFAGKVNVVDVKILKTGAGEWRFDVSVQHNDEGWEHYANRWDVVTLDGKVLGSRILHHPHVEEQPFTRSAIVKIPSNIKKAVVRANDSVHGLGGHEVTVDLDN